MINVRYEPMREDFIEAVRAIYNYYVANTTSSFYQHDLDASEMRGLLFFDNPRFQSFAIILEETDEVIGYVGLRPYSPRESYDFTAEVSLYLARDYIRQGIGFNAFEFIENLAQQHEFHVLITSICFENEASIKSAEHAGFTLVGHYHEIGWKFDRWLDSVTFEKILG